MAAAKTLKMFSDFPAPPAGLKADGKKAWATGADLWSDGTLTKRDLAAWRIYCEAFDEKAHCIKVLKKAGEYFVSAHGCVMEHPAVKRRNRAEQVIFKHQKLFGLVPEARKKRAAVQQGVASRKR